MLGLPVLTASADESAQCRPDFPYERGWMGGDGIQSIPLSSGRTLWLFGDSFVRHDGTVSRRGSKMVHNVASISECTGGKWSVSHYWTGKMTDTPDAFFVPKNSNADEYWPGDGVVHNGVLYIFLVKIKKTNGGIFGFSVIGIDIARVSNPQDDPSKWDVTFIPFMDSDVIFPAISVIKKDSYLYEFSSIKGGKGHDRPVILLRFPVERIDAPAGSIQYYSKDGRWKNGANAEDAQAIMPNGVAEMTVRFHPALHEWVAIDGDGGFPIKSAIARTAPDLTGPWSVPQTIYKIPEMEAAHDRGTFCYAFKEHIEFEAASSHKALISYACNAGNLGKVINNMDIYKPRFAEVDLAP